VSDDPPAGDEKGPRGGCAVGDPRRCTARSKQSGERCKRYASPGRTVCVMHGSRSRAGIAHPGLTRLGKYSKYLPTALLETYEQARVDPELLSFRENIGVLQVRINQLLGTLNGDGAPGAWREARAALRALKAARTSKGCASAIARLEQALDTAESERKIWKAVDDATTQLLRVSEAERRRMIEMGPTHPHGGSPTVRAIRCFSRVRLRCRPGGTQADPGIGFSTAHTVAGALKHHQIVPLH
jgi:hypothetical protein